jgi:cellulose synthase (UDP-forming)
MKLLSKIKTTLITFFKKVGVLYGVAMLTLYVFYRLQFINLSPALVVFSIILFLAECHTILHLYGMFYSIWPRKYPKYDKSYINHLIRFNLFICVCGEPAEIVEATIQGAKDAAAYYVNKVDPIHKPRVIVLNDGFVAKKDNWAEIQALCAKMGVECITRTTPGGFKAGNINNALAMTPTDDPENTLDIIFDADFAAQPYFLTEIVKPFADHKVDFVQSPQRYRGEQTWVSKASGAHQIFFFDYICPAKGYDNALFLCGTNFAIRRKALLDVGGIDTNFITEDYATSINLHLAGKKGVFMPKVLALGVAPTSLKQYFSQQRRWAKGSFDTNLILFKKLFFGPLTLKQKFHYFLSATYYLIGLRDLILMLAPLPYLFFGISLIKANTVQFLLMIYGPLLIYNFILYFWMFKEPIKSLVLDIVSFPVFTAAFLSSVTKKELGFIVTIKSYEKENPLSVYKVQLSVLGILVAGLIYHAKFLSTPNMGSFINIFWATFDVTWLALGFYLITRENYNLRWFERNLNAVLNGIKLVFASRYSYPLYIGALLVMYLMLPNYPTLASFNSKTHIQQFIAQPELLVPSNGVYYGYFKPELNSHPHDFQNGIVENEHPSLTMYYQDWSSESMFDTNFNNSISDKGSVPVITWEPWNSKDQENSKTEYTPKKIAAGEYDDYIHAYAKQAADFHKPVFIRFAHEMNGNWYPWGDQNSTSQDYIAMWRHVHEIFVEEGATNVVWVWSPNNTDQFGSSDSLLSYYPGDNYVDWVGFSGFNWGQSARPDGKWMSFRDLSAGAYDKLATLNKPIMVSETSSSSIGGSKQAWFDQTLEKDIPSKPQIKAVVFYDADFNSSNFSLTSDMDYQSVISDDIVKNGYYLPNPEIK